MAYAYLEEALLRPLEGTHFEGLGERYEGKVRDNYTLSDGRRLIVVTDRISAFDHVLGTIPLKGQVLNRLAAYFFEKTKDVAPNHVLSVVDPNVLACRECAPLPVEFVVRAYATGTTSTSLWTHYERGARTFCGHVLPEGLKKHQRLAHPIVTPATKAPIGQHDVSGSREEMLAGGRITGDDFDRAAKMALALFARGEELAAARGLLFVDTKYEFGKTRDGEIVVIDEIHTPDSSRYWIAASYEARLAKGEDPESLDKDFVRRSLLAGGYSGDGPPPPLSREVRLGAAERYIRAYEMLTGEIFVPDLQDPISRIESVVRKLVA